MYRITPDSEVISIEIPGFPLMFIKKHPVFALIAKKIRIKDYLLTKDKTIEKSLCLNFRL